MVVAVISSLHGMCPRNLLRHVNPMEITFPLLTTDVYRLPCFRPCGAHVLCWCKVEEWPPFSRTNSDPTSVLEPAMQLRCGFNFIWVGVGIILGIEGSHTRQVLPKKCFYFKQQFSLIVLHVFLALCHAPLFVFVSVMLLGATHNQC